MSPFCCTHIYKTWTDQKEPTDCITRIYCSNPTIFQFLLEEVWIPFTFDGIFETNVHLCSMCLINVKAFLEQESLIGERKPVDGRTTVLEFGDDQATEYVILSHQWMVQEVSYTKIVKLAKMTVEERDKICQHDGYQKIIQSCEQAQKDGYQWLWVNTCCIDK